MDTYKEAALKSIGTVLIFMALMGVLPNAFTSQITWHERAIFLTASFLMAGTGYFLIVLSLRKYKKIE